MTDLLWRLPRLLTFCTHCTHCCATPRPLLLHTCLPVVGMGSLSLVAFPTCNPPHCKPACCMHTAAPTTSHHRHSAPTRPRHHCLLSFNSASPYLRPPARGTFSLPLVPLRPSAVVFASSIPHALSACHLPGWLFLPPTQMTLAPSCLFYDPMACFACFACLPPLFLSLSHVFFIRFAQVVAARQGNGCASVHAWPGPLAVCMSHSPPHATAPPSAHFIAFWRPFFLRARSVRCVADAHPPQVLPEFATTVLIKGSPLLQLLHPTLQPDLISFFA